MHMIFIKENCEIELKFEDHGEFKIIKRVDKFDDGREYETVEKYDSSWNAESVRFFFVSKANAIIGNGGKIKDVL